MKNKGQMFLLTSVIMVILLIALKISSNVPDILEKERKLHGDFETEFFINSVDELSEAIRISAHQSNISTNVYDYSNFTRTKLTERLLTFNMLFVGVNANHSTNQMNITVLNFLNENINAVLTMNGSSDSQNNIADQGIWETNFSYTDGNLYVLYISYDSGAYNESITLDTPTNKNRYYGFFDVELVGTESTYKDKFQKSYKLD